VGSSYFDLPMLVQTIPVQQLFVSVAQKKQQREKRRKKAK